MNNCPNCGSKIKEGDTFCGTCGTKLHVQQNQPMNNIQVNQPMNNQNNNYQQQNYNQQAQSNMQYQSNMYQNNDYDLIDAYIGKNADKLKNEGFSVNTFFFGSIYVLYRKMWLLGLIWLAAGVVASIFLKSIAGYLSFAANIAISIMFKKMYMKHVREEVGKIKLTNPNMTREQLISICKQKGGTTIVPVIIAIIIYVAVFVLAFLSAFLLLYRTKKLTNDNTTETPVVETRPSEEMSKLDINIPSIFEESKYSSSNYKSYSMPVTETDNCSLYVQTNKVSSYYNDAKVYLEKKIYYSASEEYSGISEKEINNKKWYYATVTSSYTRKYYYSTENNGSLYEIEFNIYNDTNEKCSSAYNTIVESLKFKE